MEAIDKSVSSLQNTTTSSLNAVTSVHNISSNPRGRGSSNYNSANCNHITATQNPTTAITATSNAMNYQSASTLSGDLNQYEDSSFNSTPNHNEYPQDLQSSYFPYSSMLTSIGNPFKSNYVGSAIKPLLTDIIENRETGVQVQLYVELLNHYLFYFERGNSLITVAVLNRLIEKISKELRTWSPDKKLSNTLVNTKSRTESNDLGFEVSIRCYYR
uniref:Uncharacterized protein n=1 Tax=Glossina austeni TaxID=7395 RepID=A0A1A9UHE5_GLOAU